MCVCASAVCVCLCLCVCVCVFVFVCVQHTGVFRVLCVLPLAVARLSPESDTVV